MPSRAKRSGDPKHYGAPLSTPKPGGSRKKRPKVGDKDPNYDPDAPRRKPRTPSKPEEKKKPGGSGSEFRDYRGVDGAVEDAEKGKKKK